MNQLTSLLFLAAFMLSTFSQAGEGGVATGGGGSGVEINGKIFLLDLFQVDRHRNPYYSPIKDLEKAQIIFEQISSSGHYLKFEPQAKLLAQKIAEIAEFDTVLAHALISAFKDLTWSFTESQLLPTKDIIENPLLNKNLRPLAVRQAQNIYISQNDWLKMDTANQSALLLHEVLSSFSNEKAPPLRIRQLVGDLYSPEFYSKSYRLKMQRLSGLPNNDKASLILRNFLLKTNLEWPVPETDFDERKSVNTGLNVVSNILKISFVNWMTQKREEVSLALPIHDLGHKTNPCRLINSRNQLVEIKLYTYQVQLVPTDGVESPNFIFDLTETLVMKKTNNPKSSGCSLTSL